MRYVLALVPLVALPPAAWAQDRAVDGLLVLYTFERPDDGTIRDRSGVGEPLDLTVESPRAVEWNNGRMTVKSPARIVSAEPAHKVIRAVSRSGEISVEAWLVPGNARQSGPARIVTLSASPNERNFTLGQEADRFDARLRSTKTSSNGIPSLTSPEKLATARLTHVVYTRDRSGNARIYVDGKEKAKDKIDGSLANWDEDFQLALANELTNDRPWLGGYNLVAIYGRELSPDEVRGNFQAGADAAAFQDLLALRKHRASLQLFDRQVAPLLTEHCLQCHDSSTKKGGLDLSRQGPALAGGESGPAIVPGKAGESMLWELVRLGEMPKGRDPLSKEEQELLRRWIEEGAVWSTDFIDPAVYAHAGDATFYVQRLTVGEYIETVRSAVGVDVEKEARDLLPRELRADGFSNTAYNLNVDLQHVDAYARLAEIIVGRMDMKAFVSRFSKQRTLDADKLAELIAEMGKWLLRGPLEPHELNAYRGIAATVASAGGDFDDAIRYIVEAMLQSPRFIYRLENQRGAGAASPVGDFELASRLSYILWGGPPDEQLMQAAESGELQQRGKLQEQVQRMLKDPRTVERSLQFVDEWLNLARLPNLRPNPGRFPDWQPELAADMRQETLRYFKELAWTQNRPMADLLNADLTFATPRLARHYGLEPRGEGWEKYDLSDDPAHGGLLTQGSILTVGGDDASMVTRGLFVLHDLLRGTVNAPPPCVDTTPVPTKAGLTQRDIAEARIADMRCGICHARFEPLAFGLEKFDGLGTFRNVDQHGNKLREDGEILFPGAAEPVSYKTAAELMDLLAGSDRVRETITWKITQFALGRPLTAADAPVVAQVHETAAKNGGTYADVITALVLSDLVRKGRPSR